ncbi:MULTISPECIES: hypothetical protein [unclassified Nocardia]|uniref:hypothetical protein n=1 Tax=unclassified Nocardia TaxID=2637762 RepID=UPI001CE40AE6|nr:MULTISPECIES: hypothetical protein [unclassified Nocardia]
MSSTWRIQDLVALIAAASAAPAVTGNTQAQRISAASMASETMTVSLAASISVPALNAVSDSAR